MQRNTYYLGSHVITCGVLALLNSCEDQLLAMDSIMSILPFLQKLPTTIVSLKILNDGLYLNLSHFVCEILRAILTSGELLRGVSMF
jgi:hypothetical protein